MSPHGLGWGGGAGANPPRLSPLGIVGPGATPAPEREPDNGDGGTGALETGQRREPRRFVVPEPRESREADEWLGELRRLVRDGGILLGAEQTSLFLFDEADAGPVRRIVRFHLSGRRFETPALHPAEMAGEARAFMSGVSRAEVADSGDQAPSPGAMRDYLQASGVQGLLSLPLRKEGRIVGFVSFESTSTPRRWSAEERGRAQSVVGRIEAALPSGPVVARLWDAAVERSEAPPATGRGGEGRRVVHAGNASRPGVGLGPGRSVPMQPTPDPSTPTPEGPRELRTRLPRLRPLEGAALLGAELGEELLQLLDVQESTLQLLDQVVEDEPAELVEELRSLSTGLREGMRSLVDAARGGMAGHEVVDLGEALSGAVHRLASAAGEGVRFLVSPCSDALPVRGNVALLERVVRNLVENARQATEGGGQVQLSWDRAQFEGPPPDEMEDPVEVARLRVEDDGRGIRPEHLPWIFEPHFTTGEKGSGRGLGLSTVQAVVEGHGGWVDVRSRVDQGTVVTVHIPLAEARREKRPSPAIEPRVLVIEDEPALGRLLERVLAREGCEVAVATSGSAARRLWSAGGGADLVLLERRLAGREGEVALPLARAWKRERPGLRVILVDRGGDPETPLPGDPWVDDVLRRPFHPEAVSRVVRRQLEFGGGDERGGEASSPSTEAEGPERHAVEADEGAFDPGLVHGREAAARRRARPRRDPIMPEAAEPSSIDVDGPPPGSTPH